MIIEVWTKEKYSKNEELDLFGRLSHTGLKPSFVKISRLYKINAEFSKEIFKKITEEILIDPITEEYSLSGRDYAMFRKAGHKLKGKNLFRVEVWLKDSVTDVIGESVQQTISDVLGKKPGNVRYGHAYYLSANSQSKLKHAVSEVLINDLIHTCHIKSYKNVRV